MPDQNGTFVWYDVMTPDTAAAATFYGQVVGWQSADVTMSPDYPYTLFSDGGTMVAGAMPIPEPARA